VTVQGLLAGHRVSQAMRTHCDSVPADLTLQQLVDEQCSVEGPAVCWSLEGIRRSA
jgi:hypothetical protein